ncbi:MAG: ATP-dependent DNA helicase RecG, partial [Oscillospiraceae bacterium]|nr:ATP-dependent DNA helicase RecG [Oscillospiraceae bacterium]
DYSEVEKARERLIFEEFFIFQLGLLLLKDRKERATSVVISDNNLEKFCDSLPFSLTNAQLRSMREIAADIGRDIPMSRLLQGDVGSGKTVVAAAAVAAALKAGYQSAFMAPTEILASQHADSLSSLLSAFGANIGLLTGGVRGKNRRLLLENIACGNVNVVVGTHALISEEVVYRNLGLVIADEQHRFGVEQRMSLSRKGNNPHLLVMSATPIPRTLALMIYGELDISVIDELPKGRIPQKTYLVTEAYRERYLNFLKKMVDKGHQAFIVCPLIEESALIGDRRAATQYKEELEKGPLNGYSVGLIHGKMKPIEKQRSMEAFKNGDISILVSTTVIEVGVDVPSANVMIVENAESFGLFALHQLRGRIGRGGDESFCILVAQENGEKAKQRLRILTESNDGFAISSFDLALRGPGDLFGKRQHGLPEFRIADLAGDERVLLRARTAAKELLEDDPALESHPDLKTRMERMFEADAGIYN